MKKNLTILYRIITIIICITLVIGVLLKVLSLRRLTTDFQPIYTKETSTVISNPFCGFYQLAGYTPTDKKSSTDAIKWWKKHLSKSSESLILLEINLKDYSKKNLSGQALQQINTLLDQCTSSKKQLILRFLYDWDGKAKSTEPANFDQIRSHIAQLSIPVNIHKDCIYIIQGLFIGNYGEMHHSKYHTTHLLQILASDMNKNFDPSIYLAVRTPAQMRRILQSNTPGQTGSADESIQALTSRLGLFNDGMLGSVTDLGTYGTSPLTEKSSYGQSGTRAQELYYQKKLGELVPIGGEVIFHKKLSNLMSAINAFSTMHVSYLNEAHDIKVIKQWQRSTYTGKGVFAGTNGYHYMQSHLGYRYTLKQSNLDFHSFVGNEAYLYLTIGNSGFSPAYRSFDTYLLVTDQKTKKAIRTLKTEIDNCSISAQDKSTFRITLNVRTLKKGAYNLSLKMVDPYTKQSIHFANDGYENSNEVPIGTLTLR